MDHLIGRTQNFFQLYPAKSSGVRINDVVDLYVAFFQVCVTDSSHSSSTTVLPLQRAVGKNYADEQVVAELSQNSVPEPAQPIIVQVCD